MDVAPSSSGLIEWLAQGENSHDTVSIIPEKLQPVGAIEERSIRAGLLFNSLISISPGKLRTLEKQMETLANV